MYSKIVQIGVLPTFECTLLLVFRTFPLVNVIKKDISGFRKKSSLMFMLSSAKLIHAGVMCLQVVAAELHTEGSKDVVIYKIRVADDSGEWTVSRRFRNFETLQRTLREMPAYRCSLLSSCACMQ